MVGSTRCERESAAISPTARFTSHVWTSAGLGEPALDSPVARLAGRVGAARGRALDRVGALRFETFLLARHQLIDHLLVEAIEGGRVTTVVELAAGLSPRGLRMTRRFSSLDYVEVDLPAMVERKRERLLRSGSGHGGRLRVEAVDVFDGSLDEVFTSIDPTRGLAVVTEGLVNYFPTAAVLDLWARLVAATDHFPQVCYFSDLHLDCVAGPVDRLVAAGLGVAVRGRVYFHFDDAPAAEEALLACGFASATVHVPSTYAALLPDTGRLGADRVRVISASRP
ncbi:MAG: class I SAM-dependent methyltransferase [Ornithinibacter sp.]